MRKLDQYLSTIDTMYPDSYARERVFRDEGEMVSPAPFQAQPRNAFERLLGVVGQWQRTVTNDQKQDYMDKPVVVEEDAILYSNVTLLSGVTVGRGAVVGSGSVVRNNVPPYAVVMGNPARVVGFRFTPEQIVEHEKQLYPEEERLDYELISRNYQKFYTKNVAAIAKYVKSGCY